MILYGWIVVDEHGQPRRGWQNTAFVYFDREPALTAAARAAEAESRPHRAVAVEMHVREDQR